MHCSSKFSLLPYFHTILLRCEQPQCNWTKRKRQDAHKRKKKINKFKSNWTRKTNEKLCLIFHFLHSIRMCVVWIWCVLLCVKSKRCISNLICANFYCLANRKPRQVKIDPWLSNMDISIRTFFVRINFFFFIIRHLASCQLSSIGDRVWCMILICLNPYSA